MYIVGQANWHLWLLNVQGGSDQLTPVIVDVQGGSDQLTPVIVNVQGGSDQLTPVIVSRVAPNTPADLCLPRLTEGDQVLFINGRDISQHTHAQVT